MDYLGIFGNGCCDDGILRQNFFLWSFLDLDAGKERLRILPEIALIVHNRMDSHLRPRYSLFAISGVFLWSGYGEALTGDY